MGGGWRRSEAPLMPDALCPLWTEHGDRRWLTSLAAELGVSKNKRDYLGRWVPQQSDDYVDTARAIVYAVQLRVTQGFREKDFPFDESVLSERIRGYLQDRGWDQDEARDVGESMRLEFMERPIEEDAVLAKIPGTPAAGVPMPGTPGGTTSWTPLPSSSQTTATSTTTRALQAHGDNSGHGTCAGSSTDPVVKRFLICRSRKTGFARLHITGACSVRPGVSVYDYEFVNDVESAEVDGHCRRCWPRGTGPEAAKDGAAKILAHAGLQEGRMVAEGLDANVLGTGSAEASSDSSTESSSTPMAEAPARGEP
eukprot:9988111-Lingulodinium_polyedra.AAC.2